MSKASCTLRTLGLAILVFLAIPRPVANAIDHSVPAEVEKAIQRGLKYLAGKLNTDGSFGDSSNADNVGVVSLVGIAFLSDGSLPGKGRYGKELTSIVKFILKHCQENGFITNPKSQTHGPMYGHGFATLFLAEAYGAMPDRILRERLAKATQLIIDTQNEEGGWRYFPQKNEADVSVTICQVMALRAARNAGFYVPNSTIDRCIDYVRKCQNPDGGFRYILKPGSSDFPRTAAGIVTLYSAGVYKGDEIDRALQYLKTNRPQSDSGLEESHYFYGHYYAAQAMWQSGDKNWSSWYPSVCKELLKMQSTYNGSWKDPVCNEYGTAMATIILQTPNNFLPIFQR